jgi:hypothetical protein
MQQFSATDKAPQSSAGGLIGACLCKRSPLVFPGPASIITVNKAYEIGDGAAKLEIWHADNHS